MLVRFIIVLNVMVFIGWSLAAWNFTPLQWMMDNFLVSWDALEQGLPWVLITSVFSHSNFLHLFINMYVLRSFGTVLVHLLGPISFLNFYLIAGIVGSFTHALVSLIFLNAPSLPALGASGAIAGVILLFSLMFPKEKLLLMGLVPIDARWAALLIVGIDVWGLVEQSRGGGLPIGHGAHLGGAMMGIVWYFTVLKKRRAKLY